MNRRLFIRASGRWLMLASLLAITGFLGWKQKIGPRSACPDDSYCLTCRYAQSCKLPKRNKFLANDKEQTV